MGWAANVTPRPLYHRKRPGTHCIGGWVEPQGRSGRVQKISHPSGLDPRTVKSVAVAIPTELSRPSGNRGSYTTPWCRVLLEELTGLQLVKNFPAFYGTRRFFTAFTSFRHPSLSWASPIQSTCPQLTSWRSILLLLLLSTHLRLGLPSGLFPSGFPTRTLYAPLSSPYGPHAHTRNM